MINDRKILPTVAEQAEHLENIAADLSQTTTQLVDCIKQLSSLPSDQQTHMANVLSRIVETQRGEDERK
tara:strand:+ start:4889 stop:5095 length:207 start_codon:yes stop_codon:yes gene_type:complete